MGTKIKIVKKKKEKAKQENSFVNDLELIEVNKEYEKDRDPKRCMECPDVLMDWSDLSDHMRKDHQL